MENSKPSKKKRYSAYEVIAAIVLGILAIGSFAFEAYIYDSKTTQRETALFGVLQFLLTLGFGWSSTRAAARAEFENSLKQFAIGAYRRITDIEAMIERLRARIEGGDSVSNDTKVNIQVAKSVLEDTLQVVRSSTADWADVIGDEILTLQNINTLRRERNELEALPELQESVRSADQRMKEIDAKIEHLTNALPANLQIESRRKVEDEMRKNHEADWMRRQHVDDEGLRLSVIAGGQWRCDGDVTKLDSDTVMTINIEEDGVNVRDAANVRLGRVLNNSPLDYDAFSEALSNCYAKASLRVKFQGMLHERRDDDGTVRWYVIQVSEDPAPRKRPPRRRRALADEPARNRW